MKNYLKKHQGDIQDLLKIASILLFFLWLGSLVDLNFVNQYIEKAGIWGPLFFILIKSLTIILAPLSGIPIYVFASTLFGIEKALVFTLIGDFLGYSILFFISRRFGLRALRFVLNKKDSHIISVIQKYTSNLKSFIKISLIFFWFPEGCIAAAGLGKIKYYKAVPTYMIIDFTSSAIIILISHNILF